MEKCPSFLRVRKGYRNGSYDGPTALFLFGGPVMGPVEERVETIITHAVEALGYELVGIEFQQEQGGHVLRVYIDNPRGISVDDCAHVSYQVSGVLDVEDPIPEAYRLEISSPGLDRPLFKLADYERFAGERVQLRLTELWQGRRKLTGELRGVMGEEVVIEVDGSELRVPAALIRRARLVPNV